MAALHKGFVRHRKFSVLSDRAFRLWVAGWAFCNDELTDGVIYKTDLPSLGIRVTSGAIHELLSVTPPYHAPLWEERGDHYLMHDFLEWNDSREQVQRDRARLRARVQQTRNRRHCESGNAVTAPVTEAGTAAGGNPVTTDVTVRSTTNDQRPKDKNSPAAPDGPSCGNVENSGNGYRVISALVRSVLAENRDYTYDGGEADLVEDLKTRCAQAGLRYNRGLVQRALDSERAKRIRGAA